MVDSSRNGQNACLSIGYDSRSNIGSCAVPIEVDVIQQNGERKNKASKREGEKLTLHPIFMEAGRKAIKIILN
jgi:hypothetical protein